MPAAARKPRVTTTEAPDEKVTTSTESEESPAEPVEETEAVEENTGVAEPGVEGEGEENVAEDEGGIVEQSESTGGVTPPVIGAPHCIMCGAFLIGEPDFCIRCGNPIK